jgi:hypothetical protein
MERHSPTFGLIKLAPDFVASLYVQQIAALGRKAEGYRNLPSADNFMQFGAGGGARVSGDAEEAAQRRGGLEKQGLDRGVQGNPIPEGGARGEEAESESAIEID